MSQDSQNILLYRLENDLKRALRAVHYIGMAFFLILTLMTVVHAIGRYAFGKPILGIVELSSACLVLGIFLVLSYTTVEKKHITIDFLANRFPKRIQLIIDIIAYLLIFLFIIVVLWQTFKYGILAMQTGGTTSILSIPTYPFYFAEVIGLGFFSLASLILLANFLFRGLKR